MGQVMRRMLVVAALLAGCKQTSVYIKGPPRQVRIEKQASDPTILADARRDSTGGVVLRVLELREIKLTRHTRHGALEMRIEHPGHPLWELVEIPVGAILVFGVPATLLWTVSDFAGSKPDVKREPQRPALGFINPFRSMFAGKPRVYVAEHVTFDDPPRIRQYNVRLPIGEVKLRYRVLDATRAAISSGEVATDQFGKARIADVPAHAVGIELQGDRIDVIAPVPGQ
jgi:hypothetical protein